MHSKKTHQGLTLLAAGALIAAWLLPNHYPPWTSAYQEFSAFFAGLIVTLIMLLSRPTKITPAALGFLVLACIPLLQYWMGLIFFPGDAWIIFIFIFGFSLMLMAGYNLASQQASRQQLAQILATVLVIGAFLSLWVALRQWLQLPADSSWTIDSRPGGRPFGNLAQPNSLATLLCLGLAGVLYLYERYLLGRLTAGLLAILLIFGVGLTQSRTPWVAAVAVLIFWSWKTRVATLRFSAPALLGWICCYALVLLALPSISDSLLLATSDPLSRAGSLQRLNMWGQLWLAIQQGPFWGYGWGQVSVAQMSVAAAYPATHLTTLYSHNALLDILLWNGPWLGSVIILCLAAWLLRIGFSARSPETLFALVAAGFVLVHSMLEYPLAYAFFLLPLGLLLGLAASEHTPSREFHMPRWVLGVGWLLATGLFVWFWKEYRVIEEYYRVTRLQEARITGVKAGRIPEVILLTEPREYIRFVHTPVNEELSDLRLEWMRKVTYRRPGAFSLFRYALALGVNGHPIEAHKQLKIIRAQYGEKTYNHALAEIRRQEVKYPQLSTLRKRVSDAAL